MKKFEEMSIPKEKFALVQENKKLSDEKFDTKPIGYFKDAFNRFRKNKASIVGACIIAALLLISVVVTIFSRYQVSDYDLKYAKVLPRLEFLKNANFWDGASNTTVEQSIYQNYVAMSAEKPINGAIGGANAIKKINSKEFNDFEKRTYYDVRVDSYALVGYNFINVNEEEFRAMQRYQEENNVQLLYPVPDKNKVPKMEESNANYWYMTKTVNNAHNAVLDGNGDFIPIYYTNRNDGYNSRRIEGDDGSYVYGIANQSGYKVRVLYSAFYEYKNGFSANFVFGTNPEGRDMLICVAVGTLFSMLLALLISAINMFIGAIYGAISGYYGGKVDLIMERFSDLMSSMPQLVIITLFQLFFSKSVGPVVSLLFAMVTFGWIGIAAKVRMQFYRYKRQEYVFAARTLGASDRRLIFRHIYPNSLGTLITSSVLIIPGVIFTESTLTYLGIVNLGSTNITSLGSLLASGQTYLATFPHIILFPSLIISLLMISFNLFGNGLRDAFNPALRGVED